MKTTTLRTWFALVLVTLTLLACESESTPAAKPEPVPVAPEATSPQASEDERLLAFFQEVFDRDVSQSPEFQAQLGIKTEDYGSWDDHSDAHAIEMNQQTENDLQRLRAEFDY
ncbi:MAG TPA: hypothetical protein VFG52_03480, partial [Xanthomonadales bacterium]|nr:hypothetical protein [Xanthomonadales bacterium]